MGRIRSFLFGVTLPLQSVSLMMRQPRLWLWSAFPLAIALALYIFGLRELQNWATVELQSLLSSHGVNSESWIATLALLLARIVLVILGVILFSTVSAIATSPFNDFLAEATESLTSPALPVVRAQGLGHRARLILIDLAKTLAAALASLSALLLSWLPVVNALALLLTFLLICFQFISYPQTRRGEGLGQALGFLWRHLFACAGFGAAFSFLFAIPIVGALTIPVAVVAGTILYAEARKGLH